MSTDLATTIESVVIGGDLSKLTPDQRVNYYQAVCKSLGLNPLTKPFDYITLNGKLTLYARKDATDQLRDQKHYNVSITELEDKVVGDIYIVKATAVMGSSGRTDSSIGAVSLANLKGADLANAYMKAETKAKRRVTLSICGLGMLDETEIETIPNAVPVTVIEETGEIVEGTNPDPITDDNKKEYGELEKRADAVGVEYEKVNYDRVTKAELREMWIALNKKVKIAEEAKRLDAG